MRRYHWILTLQVFKPQGGTSFVDGHGTTKRAPGQTRRDVFEQARAYICEQSGIDDPARTAVMFFALDLDEL